MYLLNPFGRGRRSAALLCTIAGAALLVPAGNGPASAAAGGAGARSVCAIGGADAFFAVVKNGADAAGAAVTAAGSKYTWIPLANYDNIGPDMVKLIQQAVSLNCTSLALPDWVPAAENPAIAAAQAKGIKVFLYNAGGEEQVKATKALGYFGTDEYLAGVKAGEYFGSKGSKNVICVNTSPGSVNIEARCKGTADGVKKSGGKSTQLVLPGKSFGDAAAISNAVKGAIGKDKTIDGVITIASGDADAVALAIKAASSKAKQGSFDVSTNILNRVKSGEALFAVDQQGWLQGWLAVSAAWQYDQYAILPATNIILTGPALITAENVDTISAGVKSGQR
jgi:simple sugar transport system substrate-binding protein